LCILYENVDLCELLVLLFYYILLYEKLVMIFII